MNKKFIIRKNEEIQSIIKESKKKVSNFFIIYFKCNKLPFNRYCVSVSKKIGKAHTRNLFKRRVKDILMKLNYNNSCDYVIILRKSIIDANFENIKKELIVVMKGEKYEK